MAHYAILDEDDMVIEVITGVDEDDLDTLPEEYDDWESFYSSIKDDNKVVRTSYNTRFGVHYKPNTEDDPSEDQSKALRGNYAGIGYHYLEDEDVFLPPRRYDYYVPDLENYIWVPPLEKPDDQNYYWDDDIYQDDNTKGWVLIPEPEE